MNSETIQEIIDFIDEKLGQNKVTLQDAYDTYEAIGMWCATMHNALWYDLNKQEA